MAVVLGGSCPDGNCPGGYCPRTFRDRCRFGTETVRSGCGLEVCGAGAGKISLNSCGCGDGRA